MGYFERLASRTPGGTVVLRVSESANSAGRRRDYRRVVGHELDIVMETLGVIQRSDGDGVRHNRPQG